jgi:hypothetical protein
MYLYFHLEFIRVYVLYSYIFKTETRVIFFIIQQRFPLILFVRINDI